MVEALTQIGGCGGSNFCSNHVSLSLWRVSDRGSVACDARKGDGAGRL